MSTLVDRTADDALAAIGSRGELSRTAFWRRVNGLGAVIAARDARRYALICKDTVRFAEGLLALMSTGRTAIVPQAPKAGSLADSGTPFDAVLTDTPEAFADAGALDVNESVADAPDCAPGFDDDARVEFQTSGSGGAPKCIVKRFGQLRLENEALERQWGPQLEGAVIVAAVPHYHMYGVNLRILWPLIGRRPFTSRTYTLPAALTADIAGRRCVIVASPAFLSRVENVDQLPDASQVAGVFSSGAPLPEETAKRLKQDWGHAPIEIYGSTETGGIAWRRFSGVADDRVWRPLDEVEIDLRAEPVGERLWVKSAWTDGADWFATGDFARRDSSGGFSLAGRVDDIVKFEDKRVSLEQMRRRLVRHAWARDARLVLVPGRRQVIGAAVILSDDGRAAFHECGKLTVRRTLEAWLGESHEPLLIPRKWRFPASWPTDAMSKVGRGWLKQLFETPE
jgi:acyl-coenzyme A synthetase/AMP-(fatty) acid ligase